MDFLFFFSWLGPVLVVISLALPNVMWFRVINMTGSTISAIFAVIDETWPFVFMNGAIALINVYWIWRLTRTRRREVTVAEPAVSGENLVVAETENDARPTASAADLDSAAQPAPASTLGTNSTITQQLGHRSIRAFTSRALDPDSKATLLDVARHAPTSSFYQGTTIIEVKDPSIREAIFRSSQQPYVGGDRGSLFVFVVDLSRVARIREAAGLSNEPIERPIAFLQGVEDTMAAAQNMLVAAESLGLGACYLGSIIRDVPAVIDALNLPEFTFPLVGMLVGYPAQNPQRKPRLPQEITTSVDTYPDWTAPEYVTLMNQYDQTIQQYYDLRDGGKRQDSYTKQMRVKPGQGPSERIDLLAELRAQGLCTA